MKSFLAKTGLAGILCSVAVTSHAQIFPNQNTGGPNYLIRYFNDQRYRDEGQWFIREEGIFDTVREGNEVVRILAHLYIAYRVDCACEEIRRDAIGAIELEEQLMTGLPRTGYNPRLIPAADVGDLPAYLIASPPYVEFPRFGPVVGRNANGSATNSFDPNNDRLYARGTVESVFRDTRIRGNVLSRADQIMGGHDINDATSLCAYAENVHNNGALISTVLIEDLRRTWEGQDQ